MWNVNGQNLTMTEEDWGISLPYTFSGVTLTEHDAIRLTIKTAVNGDTLIEREYTNISQNKIEFSLTEEESALLPVGSYVYKLDWYQDGAFMCNVIPFATLKVVEKA